MNLRSYQQDAIDEFFNTGYVCVIAKRQQGTTTFLRELIEYQLQLEPNYKIWVCTANRAMFDICYGNLLKKYKQNLSWNFSYADIKRGNSLIPSVTVVDVINKSINCGLKNPDVIVADNMVVAPNVNFQNIKIACAWTSEISNIISWYGETL